MTLLLIARGLATDSDRDALDEQIAAVDEQQQLSQAEQQQAAVIARQWRKGEPLPLP
jgi:ABC-type Mn2+/Zn2+ transport system ATPase subunit